MVHAWFSANEGKFCVLNIIGQIKALLLTNLQIEILLLVVFEKYM